MFGNTKGDLTNSKIRISMFLEGYQPGKPPVLNNDTLKMTTEENMSKYRGFILEF